MDPDECLKQIRDLIMRVNAADDRGDFEGFAADLAEHVEALDEWLSKGGFLPDAWRNGPIKRIDKAEIIELSLDQTPGPYAGFVDTRPRITEDPHDC
jgi:hypothetical protein